MFDQARAAVSLTYDDGMPQHLDHARPDLEAHGLRGTFYVPTGVGPEGAWNARAAEWVSLCAAGHEVGNHSRVHPCRGNFEPNLKDYTHEQIAAELTGAQADLDARVGAAARSFAYPCCNTTVGPDSDQVSYVEFTESLFPASRVCGNELAVPADIDFRLVPSFIVTNQLSEAEVIQLFDRAIAEKKWLVLTFHGIGGGHLNYDRPAHQAICKAIADRSADLQCGTFVQIATLIRNATNRQWSKYR